MNRPPLILCAAAGAVLALAACKGGGGLDATGQPTAGSFAVTGVNVRDGDTWQLNRVLRIEFNHPLDPTSVSFGTVRIRGLAGAAAERPVIGTFDLPAADGGRVLLFRPTCPRAEALDDGGFLPGGFEYEISIPTASDNPTALRDSSGRRLERGLRRTFRTPAPPTEALFLDESATAPVLLETRFPDGLNLFSIPDPVIELRFDQSVDPRAANLSPDRVALHYAAGPVGSVGESDFPETHRVPGALLLRENCGVGGALVEFRITGVLPPNRRLRLTVRRDFVDLVGQAATEDQVAPEHVTPSLAAFYADPSFAPADPTADEFRDGFDSTAWLAMDEALPLPSATWQSGSLTGQLTFPGTFVAEDQDLILLAGNSILITDSAVPFTDGTGRQHVVDRGVLRVNDVHIAAGATLRCYGSNPLVIYATGKVTIDGNLDLSGFNGRWPTSLNSPQFTEGGAAGACGGGQGGDACWAGLTETVRGETGDGPFGITHAGGQGGEGGWQDDAIGNLTTTVLMRQMVGGGGGGGFARTLNQSVLYDDWPLTSDFKPTSTDDAGPDHNATRHPRRQVVWTPDPDSPAYGAEDGLRAPTVDNNLPADSPGSVGLYGMEDLEVDRQPAPEVPASVDPPWTVGDVPPFDHGNPTDGPDGGRAGPAIFQADGDLADDFWGVRLNADGSTSRGELLAPWAGAGGGGGGDSCTIVRTQATLRADIPLRPFIKTPGGGSAGWTGYHKGAAGGGGGGQLLLFALSDVKIGAAARIKANGGVGYCGEALTGVTWTMSGSGGGSGGHLVLHTNGRLDLSAIQVGSASNASQIGNLTPAHAVQAFGGRRGWAAPVLTVTDGNDDFQFSRGGAGGNGVIQIHVADPARDVVWPAAASAGIREYLGDPVDPDRLEEVLALFATPQPYALVPFFHTRTMAQSRWIDTGLAGLRSSANSDPQQWTLPDYAHALLQFAGVDSADGSVLTTGSRVTPLAEVATAGTAAALFDSFEMSVPNASAHFDPLWLRNPALLIGYDLLPDADGNLGFEIVGGSYDRAADLLRLQTRPGDGPLTFAVNPERPTWSIRAKFFRLEASGVKDSMPANVEVRFEFQGARPDPNVADQPGVPVPGPNDWTSDLALLEGCRFLRWRVILDADAQRDGFSPTQPQPSLDYLKVPFVW